MIEIKGRTVTRVYGNIIRPFASKSTYRVSTSTIPTPLAFKVGTTGERSTSRSCRSTSLEGLLVKHCIFLRNKRW